MRANLIAGQWTAGKQSNPDINPSDVSDVIDQYASGDAAAVDAAVAAARAAFPAWSVSTPQQRFDALDFAGSEILARRAELGELLAREEGKTLAEATGEAVRGARVGEAIIHPPGIDGISFPGSQAVGRRVGEAAFKRGAKFQLEMGGKNPLVVLDDAQLDQAVEVAVQGSFYSTGQRCTASSRIIVTQGIHDKFVSRLAERARALVVGDARDPKTQIGPVVDARQLEQDERYISIGKDEGARLLAGGERVKRDRNGYYFAPAVFAEAQNSMRICREEIFGPVAAVVRARDYDEALALANDTEFGLSSGICTTSLKHAAHFKRHAQAGLVMVNAPTAGVDYHVPFGGRKGSSYGPREQGRYAVEFYTTVKTAYTLA